VERLLAEAQFPVLQSDIGKRPKEPQQPALNDLFEWIGLVHCGITDRNDICEGLDFEKGDLGSVQWEGLIPPLFVHQTISSLREYVNSGKIPFAVVTTHGFDDSPVSWDSHEHGFSSSGENSYTFVILPNDEYLFYLSLGPFDTYS